MDNFQTEELKKKCEQLSEQLQQKHTDLNKSRKVNHTTEDKAHVEIFREKERKLLIEIEILKGKKPEALPKDKHSKLEILTDDVTRNLSQLKETLSVLTAKKKTMTEDIQRETELSKQLEAINQKLEEKVADTPTEVKTTQQRYIQELKEKEKKALVHNKKLMRMMVEFLNEHFPLPTQSEVDQSKKHMGKKSDSRSGGDIPATELHSLQSILEMLMNKCLDTPHDAYLTIDDRYWQPYITVLLRCNIALRHPEDDRRIKLVPFHL